MHATSGRVMLWGGVLQVELAEVPRVPDHYQADLPGSGPATMLGVVLERSRRLCLSQYQKELLTPTSYLDAFARMQDRLTRQQLAVFAGLHHQANVTQEKHDISFHFAVSMLFATEKVCEVTGY